MIRAHEIAAGACKHCQAVNPGPDSTCIWRAGDPVAPDTGRRVMAADDYDTISARVRELATAREAAWNEGTSE